jgi:hypothetical protein
MLLLHLLFLAVLLTGGVFLFLPNLTKAASSVRLSRKLNLTIGRLIGLVISVVSILLLYQTLT